MSKKPELPFQLYFPLGPLYHSTGDFSHAFIVLPRASRILSVQLAYSFSSGPILGKRDVAIWSALSALGAFV